MSDTPAPDSAAPADEPAATPAPTNSVSDPAKLIRLGTMLQTLMVEVRDAPTDEDGRKLLANIHNETMEELETILSPDLMAELQEFADCCDDDGIPTESELRVAQAQLMGWLQGLMQGMQASFAAQQAMASRQLAELQQGRGGPPMPGNMAAGPSDADPPRGGVYL